jgi:hypothetical protein
MGLPMASHLPPAGYPLTAYDIDSGALERLRARAPAATIADSPKAVAAASDIVITMGPDQLAAAANGGPAGCGDPAKWMGTGLTHIIVNTVITPTAAGASGKSYLVMLGVQQDPTRIIRLGGYQDTYVKTAHGWRIKTRWLVFYSGRSSTDISTSTPPRK